MSDRRKPIRSFVIRQGRMSAGQRRALSELWDDFGLEDNVDPGGAFVCRQPLTLEIGFGMGDSLVAMAKDQPHRNFIGVDVHKPGIGHLIREAAQLGLKNVKVYEGDAVELLQQRIVDSSLSHVQIFFPDPWPKKRHHKRRLINPSMLDLLYGALDTNGVLHIATDWLPYAEEISGLLKKDSRFKSVKIPNRPETKYERRGVRLGHRVTDIAFQKN